MTKFCWTLFSSLIFKLLSQWIDLRPVAGKVVDDGIAGLGLTDGPAG